MRKQFPRWIVIILSVISSVLIPYVALVIYTFMAGPDGPYSSPWPNAPYSDWLWLLWPIISGLLIRPFYQSVKKGRIGAILIVTVGLILLFLISYSIINYSLITAFI